MRPAMVMVCFLALISSSASLAQPTVTEPSTEKVFPAEVTFTSGEASYTIKATGVAVRKKVIIKVYGMVHYMQDAPTGKAEQLFAPILADGKAKQITMVFVRDVTIEQIVDAYRKGFNENSTEAEKKEIAPFVDKFVSCFNEAVKENDQFILRWLPGGKIVPILKGQEKPAIVNATFARVLWSIWFGEDSIIDREDLVSFITK